MKNKLEIDILSVVAGFDEGSFRLECCSKALKILKEYSKSVNTIPGLLQKYRHKYRFVGVPVVVNNRISKGSIALFPGNIVFDLGEYIVSQK